MEKQMSKSPGQAAFEAWVSLLTLPFPSQWSQLSDAAQQGWEAIAQAAIAQAKNVAEPKV